MPKRSIVGAAAFALLLGALAPLQAPLAAQDNIISPRQPQGLGVAPSFNGWYHNPDGTITLSFGYVNLNTEEVIDVPIGPNNFISPGEPDQGQPTHFRPWRHFGSFAVVVPGDFTREDRVTWTIEANGHRYEIPGGMLDSYEIPALRNPSTDRQRVIGSRPPVLLLNGGEDEVRGPVGAWAEPRTIRVGEPLSVSIAAWDEHDEGRTDRGATLRWVKYRGPGEVTFDPAVVTVRGDEDLATTTVTFDAPGEYVLHLQAANPGIPVTSLGHAQCCWTNGYVPVTVTD